MGKWDGSIEYIYIYIYIEHIHVKTSRSTFANLPTRRVRSNECLFCSELRELQHRPSAQSCSSVEAQLQRSGTDAKTLALGVGGTREGDLVGGSMDAWIRGSMDRQIHHDQQP